jgi:hypothetical protein
MDKLVSADALKLVNKVKFVIRYLHCNRPVYKYIEYYTKIPPIRCIYPALSKNGEAECYVTDS